MSEDTGGGGEKTFDPTPKRLEDARKKGDIAKSDEVTTAGVYTAFLIAAFLGGTLALEKAAVALSAFLDRADTLTGTILGPGGAAAMGNLLLSALGPLAVFLLLPAMAAMLSLFAQQGIVFAGSKLQPKLSRISPISSVKNKFGPTGLVEFGKRLMKMTAVSAIALGIVLSQVDVIIGSARGTAPAVAALLFDLFKMFLTGIVIVAAAIAAIDLSWVQFDHKRKLKMSLQELRDEMKESDGDPMLKGRRRQRAVDIATNRMLADVPTADVIIVNPTHYAVALKWTREKGSAPKCVAKGVDEVAASIRARAAEAGVPIHRDPPTARAIHSSVEIGQEIPVDHYRAVAAAIRFAEAMRDRARQRDGG